MDDTYLDIDGRPALRFERRLAHPVEKVWRAVTDPAELKHWFPAEVTVDLRVGGAMRFVFTDDVMPPSDGEVTELDPPRRFAFTWMEDTLSFDLEPADDGCVLTFTHVFDERDRAARDAAGWHYCLTQLERRLAGEPAQAPTGEQTQEHRDLYEQYVERGFPAGAPIPD